MAAPIEVIPSPWRMALSDVARAPAFAETLQRVEEDRAKFTVFPPRHDVFAALRLTSPASVRIVILGQDPYPGAGMANGLAFSVSPGIRIPASLKNIIRSLDPDLNYVAPASGSLEPWARQGVLLLNTVLTVRQGKPGSHRAFGWQSFTDGVIRAVNATPEPLIFLLWGLQAQAKANLVTASRHTILMTSHPSPLSARRGFLSDRPLLAANDVLRSAGRKQIDWELK